jgi:predicted RNase H-like HicB family nuclease
MSGRAVSEQPKYRMEIFWSEEDGGYIANIPDLKHTSAFGETREEALHEVQIAEELHLETLEEMGRVAPEPSVRSTQEDAEVIAINISRERVDVGGRPAGSGILAENFFKDFVMFQYPTIREVSADESTPVSNIVDDDFLAKLTNS